MKIAFVRPLLAASLLAMVSASALAQWKPDRPITLIVPWAPGGSTDQVSRVTAAELEKHLGQKIVIMNQPGASGSVGTKNAMAAPADGYTWTAGGAKDLGTYKVLGMLDTSASDWNLYLNVAHIAVVGVNADTPFKTMPELLAAMKANPNSISVATAGVNSSGHSAIESIARVAGVTYKHVTYDGGAPAAVAAASGETQVTTQLAAEQTDMIRAKRIRPLAVVGDKSIEIEGYGTIPPLSQFIPGYKDPINYFGIFVPKGAPPEVKQTLDRIWATEMVKSEALKKYAQSRGAMFAPMAGEEAQKAVFPAIQSYAWTQQAAGKAKVSPDTVGIPKP
ncbi:MAG: tripartite tricarboxylate transporter substrate binding protein [Hydrogenophaga sp.]|jgi:tripartite-type tricarboxylate transporter receptor subunit TctC|uniref:Bug family tripartite tricarboxylate transporter substrate binding protein n=1 Tax=Hydrogenophaga sp. TaxID=1904254 RepID=UPI0025B89AC4|nr:tripartite tricarboxylate transporter substrate binding protein [Hydrogenophaga sp.]MDO8887589.1 tripartite tricarboxylate transporter substrate binding protein [Hydrogenophaga sp.]MDO9132468.1 tripartite tricarboxylate transporter substrate binding protein [Hydrogenophaga sp.]MDO9507187.1 tripartite tricarboxylate transporter substrate binding protein [Hydrogenophaga sp.]MDP1782582.1 tripartite tricarboxylate transporter substrate binding protein [Hydrogenophaga sp.]MDP2074765.1 tripartite